MAFESKYPFQSFQEMRKDFIFFYFAEVMTKILSTFARFPLSLSYMSDSSGLALA